jgi:hypothetical protein
MGNQVGRNYFSAVLAAIHWFEAERSKDRSQQIAGKCGSGDRKPGARHLEQVGGAPS